MTSKISALHTNIKNLYEAHKDTLLFHGWHHIQFVTKKATDFAKTIDADVEIVQAAALTHDLNYMIAINSEPGAGEILRANILKEAGYDADEIARIEKIILEENLGTRTEQISKEGMALSDADTLFKALPITPILLAGRYIAENKVDIAKLASKIVHEQQPLFDKDIYFYTDVAKEKYMQWARTNLDLWKNVLKSLDDDDVKDIVQLLR